MGKNIFKMVATLRAALCVMRAAFSTVIRSENVRGGPLPLAMKQIEEIRAE